MRVHSSSLAGWALLLLFAVACGDRHLTALLGPFDSTADAARFDAGERHGLDAGEGDAGASPCVLAVPLVAGIEQIADLSRGSQAPLSCQLQHQGAAAYTFTTLKPQKVVISATSTAGPPIVELRASPCQTGVVVACTTTAGAGSTTLSAITENLAAGTWYVSATLSPLVAPALVRLKLELFEPVIGADCASAQAVDPPDLFEFARWSPNLSDSATCAPGAMGVGTTYRVTVPAQKTMTVTASPTAGDDVVLYLRDSACTGPTPKCEDRIRGGGDEALTYTNADAAPRVVQVGVKTWAWPLDVIVIDFVVR